MDFRSIERIVKGFSNHRRIQIMHLLSREGNLSVHVVAETLRINPKTASEHLRRLAFAGVIFKRYRGNEVEQALTPRGKTILKFLRILE